MRLRARPRFFLILISAMILAFCISFAVSQQSLSAGERELADANAERSALLDEVEALSAQLEFAQTDEYVCLLYTSYRPEFAQNGRDARPAPPCAHRSRKCAKGRCRGAHCGIPTCVMYASLCL